MTDYWLVCGSAPDAFPDFPDCYSLVCCKCCLPMHAAVVILVPGWTSCRLAGLSALVHAVFVTVLWPCVVVSSGRV